MRHIGRPTTALLGLLAWLALAMSGSAAQAGEETSGPAAKSERPTEAACQAACERRSALGRAHALARSPSHESGPAAIKKATEGCVADCLEGRLDTACAERAGSMKEYLTCEYYVWIAPETGDPPPPKPGKGAESLDALAKALGDAALAADSGAVREYFMPIDALLGCPSVIFNRMGPEKLRTMREGALKKIGELLPTLAEVHPKALFSKTELQAIERGQFWITKGLKAWPSCGIQGQLMIRLPASKKDESLGNLAVLAVKVGERWYHLGFDFASWHQK